MRIESIAIEKLFGIHDHEIVMKPFDQITIIHGSNGIGKTTLLRMINSLFNLRYWDLADIPFKEFIIKLDNGKKIIVEKITDDNNLPSNSLKLCIKYFEPGSEPVSFYPENIGEIDEDRLPFHINMIEDLVPGLVQMGRQRWKYINTGEILDLTQVVTKFSQIFPNDVLNIVNPDWLEELRKNIPVQLIEAQRLLGVAPRGVNRIRNRQVIMEPSVIIFAEDLSKEIDATLSAYGTLSQTLDRNFPIRLVMGDSVPELSSEDLQEKFSDLEMKSKKLISLGLLDDKNITALPTINEIDDKTKNVLSIYVQDMEEKLEVFDKLAMKIKTLKEIIDNRFNHKEMIINRENGISFKTSVGGSLSPERLSSGEQHQLVLLYELLFKTKPNSLILIDEPELSFHIGWQLQFLKDIKKISQLSSINVLIATHSPQIINDRWDLTVSLDNDESLVPAMEEKSDFFIDEDFTLSLSKEGE
jgi:predicted ATP-binding protein involved in virulence